MRKPAALAFVSLFALALSAQLPSPGAQKAVEAGRLDSINDRLRGHTVVVDDQTSRLGKMSAGDFARVDKKKEELKQLVQQVDLEIAKANKGVLSADLPEKLKRIEKLAKEIRKEFE